MLIRVIVNILQWSQGSAQSTPPSITSLDLLLMTLPLDCSTFSKTSLFVRPTHSRHASTSELLHLLPSLPGILSQLLTGLTLLKWEVPSFRSLLKCHFVSEGPLPQVEETPTPSPTQFLHQNRLVEGERGLAVGWPQEIAVKYKKCSVLEMA